MIALNGKSSSPIPMDNGQYCVLIHDVAYPTSMIYQQNGIDVFSLAMSQTNQYRCLHFQIYNENYPDYPDVSHVVPMFDENNVSNNVNIVLPIYECINPMVTYRKDTATANVVFWTNLLPEYSSFDSKYDELGNFVGYIYDDSKILKISHNEMSTFNLNTNVTRVLCSTTIVFKNLSMKGNISSSGAIDYTEVMIPVASMPIILQHVKADSPILDFTPMSSGSSTFRRHAHINNSDGGFAFATLHPGTSTPMGIPWKR